MTVCVAGWLPQRCWGRAVPGCRRATSGLTWLPLHMCALLALAGDLPRTGEGAFINLTALGRSASLPLSLDDDSPYLRDLYWPNNQSWQVAGFDDAGEGRFVGDFLAEPQTTTQPSSRQTSGLPEPEFDSGQETNVTARVGATARLHCRVRNLGQHAVSWVRRRDWHILSSGLYTYTSDERFQVSGSSSRQDWTLHVRYVQRRDNGTYVCQVATDRGLMSHYFNLHVVAPTAFILGNGEYHIGEGSTVSLDCIIDNGEPAAPRPVQWWHNDRPVAEASLRGVSVATDPGPRTHSRLTVSSATRAHSGNYTCAAPDVEPDTVNVFVSQGDNTAAIQKQEVSRAFQPSSVGHAAVGTAVAVLLELWR